MTVDKFSTEWAESGDLGTAPTTEKKETGFVRYDKPSWQRENYLQNRVEKKINEVITEGPTTIYDAAADGKFMVASGLYTESWASCGEEQNIISGGSGKEYASMVVNIDVDGNPFLIVGDNTAQKFERWDSRALTLQLTSAVYTDDLPAGTWELYSLCTDNTNIFGLFFESGANTWQVQSWSATDLAVNPDWPATGVTLPGTGTLLSSAYVPKIIVASTTQLATLNTWNDNVAANSDAVISILTKSNSTIESSGAGDCPTSDSCDPARNIASDGINIFFYAYGSTGNNDYLCSATIADPTTGCGGTGFPRSLADTINSFCSIGSTMWATIAPGTPSATTVHGFSFSAADAELDTVDLGTDAAGDNGSVSFSFKPAASIFDGINIWTLTNLYTNGAAFPPAVLKIDAGQLQAIDSTKDKALPDIAACSYPVHPGSLDSFVNEYRGSLVYDGRDVWCIVEPDASQTYSGKIIRVPLASLRS